MVYKQKQEIIKETTAKTLKKMEEFGHELVEGEYRDRQSLLKVFCEIHGEFH